MFKDNSHCILGGRGVETSMMIYCYLHTNQRHSNIFYNSL